MTPTQDPKTQAAAYLRQLVNDLTGNLGPALRGPVLREADQAIAILAEPPAPADEPKA